MFVLAALNNERYDCARYQDGAANPSQRPGSCVVSDRLPIAPPAQIPRAPDESYQGDLEAQQWMAWSAFLMVFISSAGIVLIALTLRETGQLLLESKKATVAAQSAADAAWKSEETSREIGQKQARAYVIVTGAKIETWPYRNALSTDGPDYVLSLNVKNIGQTLAKKVEVHYNLEVGVRQDTFQIRPIVSPFKQGLSNLVPDQEVPSKIYKFLRAWKQEIDKRNLQSASTLLSPPKSHLHFWGEIFYSDVFGGRHKTGFQFFSGEYKEFSGIMIDVTLDLPVCEEIENQQKK